MSYPLPQEIEQEINIAIHGLNSAIMSVPNGYSVELHTANFSTSTNSNREIISSFSVRLWDASLLPNYIYGLSSDVHVDDTRIGW